MKHSFLDRYAYQDTALHRLDGRVKVVVLAALILASATTPLGAGWTLAAYALLEVLIFALARVPLSYVALRCLAALPFVLAAAASAPFLKGGETLWSGSLLGLRLEVTQVGLATAANVIGRACVSLAALVALLSITPMAGLLESLRRLKAPPVLVMLAGFAYRYIFLLVDEAERVRMARDSRWFGRRGTLWQARVLGRMVGSLLVRSFERAERVYGAMLARGYEGTGARLPVARLRSADIGFVAVGLGLIALLRGSPLWLPRLL